MTSCTQPGGAVNLPAVGDPCRVSYAGVKGLTTNTGGIGLPGSWGLNNQVAEFPYARPAGAPIAVNTQAYNPSAGGCAAAELALFSEPTLSNCSYSCYQWSGANPGCTACNQAETNWISNCFQPVGNIVNKQIPTSASSAQFLPYLESNYGFVPPPGVPYVYSPGTSCATAADQVEADLMLGNATALQTDLIPFGADCFPPPTPPTPFYRTDLGRVLIYGGAAAVVGALFYVALKRGSLGG